VPEPMRQGIVRLVAHMFAHRDAADEGRPPAMVAAPLTRIRSDALEFGSASS